MKTLTVVIGAMALTCACFAQGTRQVPRGIHEAEQATEQSERNIPPPQISPRRDPRQRQRDANELSQLAQSLPADIEQVDRGILPKDLADKLKRIEKLSKKLRRELD